MGRIFSKPSPSRSTITAALQPEVWPGSHLKTICTSVQKREYHVTKPRNRRLEILFITGEVPSQNLGHEINYLG